MPLLVAAGTVLGASGDAVVSQSRNLEIHYTVNELALPLDSVQLWYTADHGETWRSYGFDEDRQSPVAFLAPAEGRFGFFVVVANAAGRSSAPPNKLTQPQQWAFVDDTPPVVQLHDLRATTSLGQRMVEIRWTAIDAHLPARPVGIRYRRPPETGWHQVTPDPIANTGRYDWRLPDEITGPLAIRVTVVDKGGHRVDTAGKTIEIPPMESPRRIEAPSPPLWSRNKTAEVRAGGFSASKARERALRLYAEGLALRDAGRDRQAVARLREVLKLDPQMTDAFVEIGSLFHRMGDLDRALGAYETGLSQQPTMRAALRGAAMVHRQQNDYNAAAQRLRAILRYNPNDAEVWMNLGDIAVFQGDEILAHECYRRASQSDPEATEVIAEAHKRLDLMSDGSTGYHRNGR